MGPTIPQIEAHIDRAREQLGSNLHELERRVDAATDWREQFRKRPYAFLGAAALGGAAVAAILRNAGSGSGHSAGIADSESVRPAYSSSGQMLDAWDVVKAALVGLAATRLKEYIDGLLPGFNEHYERAEHRTADIRDPRYRGSSF
jgi:Protein of unknown function (DUF3618)